MSSTMSDAEHGSKSGFRQGCVNCSRSAASSFLCDICRCINLPCISTTLTVLGHGGFRTTSVVRQLAAYVWFWQDGLRKRSQRWLSLMQISVSAVVPGPPDNYCNRHVLTLVAIE